MGRVKNGLIVFMLFLGLLTMFSLISAAASSSTTIYVDDVPGVGPNNPDEDYTSIQKAIDHAISGDIIFVYAGTYNEQVQISKTVSLIGEQKNETIIDGGSSGHVVHITANDVIIKEFTIMHGGKGSSHAGVYIQSNTGCVMKDCIVCDNANHGLFLYDADAQIENITSLDNGNNGINILFSLGSHQIGPRINNSYIVNNTNFGIKIEANVGYKFGGVTRSYHPKISNTTVLETGNYGMFFHSYAEGKPLMPYVMKAYLTVTVDNCTVSLCDGGIKTTHANGPKGQSDIFLDLLNSQISNNQEYGISFHDAGIQENSTVVTNNTKADWYGYGYTFGNWTWYEISTYNFTDDILISVGDYLWVESGSVLCFSDSSTELLVNGIILVEGTKSKPVTFTSANNQKESGQWKGIGLRGIQSESTFTFTYIECAEIGICADTSFVYADHVFISNCSKHGLYLDFSGIILLNSSVSSCNQGMTIVNEEIDDDMSIRQILVKNTCIYNNTRAGINTSLWLSYSGSSAYVNYYAYYDIDLIDSVIEGNGQHGCYIDLYGYRWAMGSVIIDLNVTMKDCLISGQKHGFHIDHQEEGNALVNYSLDINHSTILDNDVGILLDHSVDNQIKNCTISQNDKGLVLYDDSKQTWIYGNYFIDNDMQANDAGTNNWNESKPIGGNFWSDHPCIDADADGFCDQAYQINGGMNADFLPIALDSSLPEIQLTDLYMPVNSTKDCVFQATGFTDEICSGEWTIYYNPSVVSVDSIHSSDFTNLSWYDTGEGLLVITAWNVGTSLTDEFTIAKIRFAAEGELQDQGSLPIVTSLIKNCSTSPHEVCHRAIDGQIKIVALPQVSMDDICIPAGSDSGSGYIRASDFYDTIGSYECRITYDPEKMKIVSVNNSDFNIFYWYDDNVTGVLSLICVSSNKTITGNFSIAQIKFESLTDQICQESLGFSESTIYTDDIKPVSIAHQKNNGSICSCYHCVLGDMNGDCLLNSADVRYLALHLCGHPQYTPLYAPGDVNSDGTVNSGDVRYIGMFLTGDPNYHPLYP